jgi:DNA-directed RNA polymerase specialized sigma24 family protein
MVTRMPVNSNDTLELVARARTGDRDALNDIFARYRERLRRMIEIRLDWRLQSRIDASDVIQGASLDVATRLEDYLRNPKVPLFLWLRRSGRQLLTCGGGSNSGGASTASLLVAKYDIKHS